MSITTTNAVAKVAAVVAGLGLVFASFAPVTRAQSTADLQAQIAALLAQINSLQGQLGTSQSASVTFTRDLTIGSTGSDVTALQNWLIGKGYAIAAGATGYFGAQTQAALASYQAANGIAPAAGYFGPITRAKVNASAGTGSTGSTGSTSTSLSGGEADLTDYDLRNEDGTVSEGESDAKLATAKFDVDGGDVNVQRVEVTFDPNTTSNKEYKPWKFFDEVTVWDGSKKVGSASADNKDDWDENGSGSTVTYTIHISTSDVVKDGDTAELTIGADVSDSIDDADLSQKFAISVDEQGIRAVDAAGIQQYVGDEGDTVTVGFEAQQNGDLSIRDADEDPDAAILVADDRDDSETYTVFAFDVKNSDDADALINSIIIDATTSNASATTSASNIINKATLSFAGKDYNADIDGDADENTTLDFDDIDAVVGGNDTETAVLKVRLAPQNGNYDSGTKITFSVDAADVDAEGDETGDSSTVDGSHTGSTHTILLTGIDVEPKSTSQSVTTPGTDSTKTYGTFTIKFDVTAVEDDAFIKNTTSTTTNTEGVRFATAGNAFTGTTTALLTSTADLDGSYYRVDEGSTETFTLTVTLDPAATGTYEVDLTGVNFNNTDDDADSTFTISSSNGDFKTDPITIAN